MSLNAAIETVYDSFSDVKMPAFVDGCTCCMTEAEYETLTAKPLRLLSTSELNKYASAVFHTMGSEDDYQYFLPRILELTLQDDVEWLSGIEITANKIQMAGFETWGQKKQAAITNLWLAVVRESASSASDPELAGFVAWNIDSWLAAATLIPIDVTPMLAELEGSPDIIRELYNMHFPMVLNGQLHNAFLETPSEGQTQIAVWLRTRVESTMK